MVAVARLQQAPFQLVGTIEVVGGEGEGAQEEGEEREDLEERRKTGLSRAER